MGTEDIITSHGHAATGMSRNFLGFCGGAPEETRHYKGGLTCHNPRVTLKFNPEVEAFANKDRSRFQS
jgi:hypothetical protein